MSKKRILITGAGSGFGEGAAIGCQNGHDVIAGAQIWPQVTSLRQKAKSLGLNKLTRGEVRPLSSLRCGLRAEMGH